MANDSQQEQQLIDNAAEAIDRVLLNMGKKTRKETLDNVVNNSEDGKEIKFLLGPAGKASEDIQIGDEMIDKIQKALEEEKGTFSKNGKLGKDPHWKKIGEKARKGKGSPGEKAKGSPETEGSAEKGKSDNPNANAQQETPEQEGTELDGGSANKSDKKDEINGVKDAEKNAGKKTGGGKKPPTIKGNEAAFKKMGLETGMKTAGGAVQGVTGTALKAAARPIAAAIVGAGWPVIAVIGVILIIIFAIGCAAFIANNMGKSDNYPANAAGDYGQIQANLAASKITELKKYLDEDLDKFIAQIEEIKKNATGDKQGDIQKKCDEIVVLAKELKSQPAVNTDDSSAGGPAAGKKETLKADIMDKVKELVALIITSPPCLNEPELSYCGQTSTAMLICALNPNCGIKADSTTADYTSIGSLSSSSLLPGVAKANLPGKQIVEVNASGGTPDYEPLYQQALVGNPVVIGTVFPNADGTPAPGWKHYVTIVGYAGTENGVKQYLVNNPNVGSCSQMKLPETYFKNNPYPGPDYWYMYAK